MAKASTVMIADWEVRNIGKSAVELQISDGDTLILSDLEKYIKEFEYVVVKIALTDYFALKSVNASGLKFNEMQMAYECKTAQVKHSRNIEAFTRKAHFFEINTDEYLNTLLTEVTPGMFHTDRVALNPMLGPELAANRYRNWITTEFKTGRSSLFFIESNNKQFIGFAMFRVLGNYMNYLLGGIFPQYQNIGFGPQIVAQPLAYSITQSLDGVQTFVSSNNPNVIALYQYCGFNLNLSKTRYVYTHTR